ncbi:hypothetical protein [Streptomyces sp. VRA16 Mangrove soil]|uniref:hypothetical protein n=1 Tax=Streptomyces sp. VRA16 Mangrove soil TaxID=2817434 RepID=UPI001A9D4705|nr:hypothetical protein [Streptomyces sp. VRA16 Mangrove soil]MBO1335089.1 hypothetical protein [Streptomyces sp. VRA16 Mangrove soil]
MTQPPQPQDGNPYAQQQPQQPQQPGYGYPQQPQAPQQPYAAFPQQQPAPGGFAPMPPAGGSGGNPALGIAVGVVVALILAWAYGAIMKATEHEIGYAAIAVGFLVGLVAGKLGGRNMAVPVVSALVSIGAVYLGQLTGLAMAYGDYVHISFIKALTDQFSLISEAWKQEADFKTYAFIVIGGIAAFGSAKKAAS